jgi:hypothetical protein
MLRLSEDDSRHPTSHLVPMRDGFSYFPERQKSARHVIPLTYRDAWALPSTIWLGTGLSFLTNHEAFLPEQASSAVATSIMLLNRG